MWAFVWAGEGGATMAGKVVKVNRAPFTLRPGRRDVSPRLVRPGRLCAGCVACRTYPFFKGLRGRALAFITGPLRGPLCWWNRCPP